ncbi:LCCL domain-containing protein [Roseomonas populi]|uniref:LCCL domain-containing protein n=1 Tax=Roseomonas populi TaxID=3121582 RepID=A0ABT1X729_9PROT|nr:LCCL domain-containing protein [Roseomonas pecuniae]MCR0983916.1 LCCL domain-containing protein [Roseomonas pecuniae]
MRTYAGSGETLACFCPAGVGGPVWGSDTYTADSRVCRAAVHAGATGPRGGLVTVEMLPGQPRYPGSTRNGVRSDNYGAYDASYRFAGVAPPAPPVPPVGRAPAAGSPAVSSAVPPSQCPDNMLAYADSDEEVTCTCLAGAGGPVWGSEIYTADSRTCSAAVHAGAIRQQGGTVTVRMLPGQPRYPGSTRNGVRSNNYGEYRASFRFEGVAPPAQPAAIPAPAATGPTQCPDNMGVYADSSEQLTCLCPGEATVRGPVWGTDTYTADSAICRAAVHAGAIPQIGGMVTVQMLPAQTRYPGTTRNGVRSENYGAYRASYRITGFGPRAIGPVQAPVAEALRRAGQVQLYVTFRTNSADLDITAAPVLMQVRDAMVADPTLRLRLVGHTDNTGNDRINTPLSIARAESVRAWLVTNGVDVARLSAEGRGPAEPIADNRTEPGRQLNRRVQALRVQ